MNNKELPLGFMSCWVEEIIDEQARADTQMWLLEARRNPSSAEPYYELGLIARDSADNHGISIWFFVEAMTRNPNGSGPCDRIAELFRDHYQDNEQAIWWLERSMQAEPNNCWPCDRLGELYRDKIHDFAQAIEWFEQSITRNPTSSWAYDRIAEIHRDHYRDYEQAIEWFEKSASADPNNNWPCDRLGELFRDRMEDPAQAIAWFRESIKRNAANSWPYDRIAEVHRDLYRNVGAAIDWFEKSLTVQPDNAYAAEELRRMGESIRYDVFLSHSSQDKEPVEKLARQLSDAGLRPFLDKWHLVPGESWQEALEEALDQSRTYAVFVGPSGIGPWENEEMRSALEERVRDNSRRVIPVLLPGVLDSTVNCLPRFLRRLTWVDFRNGLSDPEVFRRLLNGIKGDQACFLGERGKSV